MIARLSWLRTFRSPTIESSIYPMGDYANPMGDSIDLMGDSVKALDVVWRVVVCSPERAVYNPRRSVLQRCPVRLVVWRSQQGVVKWSPWGAV